MIRLYRYLSLTLIATIALLTLGACSSGNNNNGHNNSGAGNIVEVASSLEDFSTLVVALQATELDAVLADESQTFTVFAPTDAAFALLGQDTIDALLADTEALSNILLYHVIAGQAIDAETAISLAPVILETANLDSVAVTSREDGLFVNNAKVVIRDVEASNGIIHAIDVVLIPPSDAEPTGNIVEVAISNGFDTLVTAVIAAGLDTVLADESQTFTVFAPTDAAFSALGQDTLDALLADIPALTNVLLYHVVSGQAVSSITAYTLVGSAIQMANNDTALISQEGPSLAIAGVKIEVTDVPATNGVIHVIDAVLIPPSL
jgi:uncharacterized surface protein with fasciclin (FAS1) repeats